ALVAVSVFQVRYAWEARMYTLGTALAAFSSWALFRALHATKRPRRWWLLYGFLALLFAYTHYYALFSIAAQGVFVLGWLLVRCRGNIRDLLRSPSLWNAVLAADIVVVGLLPWVPVFLGQRSQVQAAYWTGPVTAWSVPALCYQMFLAPENASFRTDFSTEAALAIALLCAVCLLALLWRARAAEWYVFWAAVVPFGLSMLVSLLDTKVIHLRFFLFTHLFFLVALAALLWRIPSRLL